MAALTLWLPLTRFSRTCVSYLWNAIVKVILAPLYFLYKLWIGLVFWLTLLALYPRFRYLLAKPERYPRAFALKKTWSRMLSGLMGCPVKTDFRTALPVGPYVICANHSSYIDTFFFYQVFTDYFLFMGKGELLKWPLFGLFFRTQDIPVHRGNYRKAYGALARAGQALQRGEPVAIYPEGTIPRDNPRMARFKNGAFKIAIDAQVPIVPVTWQTNWRILRDPQRFFEPASPQASKVVVHPPISTAGKTEADLVALRDEVFAVIDSALPQEYQRS